MRCLFLRFLSASFTYAKSDPPSGIIKTQNNSQSDVAILNVGLARTVLNPHVVASFVLMRSSLIAEGHRVASLFWLSSANDGHTKQSNKYIEERKTDVTKIYSADYVVVSSEDLRCNRGCRRIACTGAKVSPFSFLRQFYKIEQAWNLLLEYEGRAFGFHADFVLKVRPDLLWLEAFPSLSSLEPSSTSWVPLGVMTRKEQYQRLNDHVFLCQRAQCPEYFLSLLNKYRTCSSKPTYPPQLELMDAHYPAVSFLHVAYTITRIDEGAQCQRLRCGSDNYNTGCVASHLPPFYKLCLCINQAVRHESKTTNCTRQ